MAPHSKQNVCNESSSHRKQPANTRRRPDASQSDGRMDGTTQQNAALVEQAAAAAQSLEDQARKLNDAVAVFKLADAVS